MSKNQAISSVLHKPGIYIKKYSPVALSCIASVGVVVTAVVAVKATPKAMVRIHADSRKNHDGNPYAYTKKEAVVSAWKCYIPAVAIGASTIACIMGANALNRSQQAALTSAYALVQSSYKEYQLLVGGITLLWILEKEWNQKWFVHFTIVFLSDILKLLSKRLFRQSII